MVADEKRDETRELVRRRLVDAETAYRQARAQDYVTRLIRDAAMVDAHRAGFSSREIGELVGGVGQPNVVRARRRAMARQEVTPDGLLSPVDALRASGLGPREFIEAVREGRLRTVEVDGGVRAFRPEDVRGLAVAAADR